jgi:hypothetical protein
VININAPRIIFWSLLTSDTLEGYGNVLKNVQNIAYRRLLFPCLALSGECFPVVAG